MRAFASLDLVFLPPAVEGRPGGLPKGSLRRLLSITAILETATGAALVAAPSDVASVLLGTPLEAAAPRAVARIAGMALLAIGVHCWQARGGVASPAARGVVAGMLLYNCGVAVVLGLAATVGTDRLRGVGLWPAVGLHTVFAAWCLLCLARGGRVELSQDAADRRPT